MEEMGKGGGERRVQNSITLPWASFSFDVDKSVFPRHLTTALTNPRPLVLNYELIGAEGATPLPLIQNNLPLLRVY